MNLKKKYQLLLFLAVVSVPVLMILINFVMMAIYQISNVDVPFHESFAYRIMIFLFFVSFFVLAYLFSRTINSLLKKINMLNETIRRLASDQKIPDTLEVKSIDEIGELTKSVNLLIERTTFRELKLKQQEENQKEVLKKLQHDINTPLTAIRLQLFFWEEQLKEQAPAIESISHQIQYISDLTSEFNLQSARTLEESYIVKKNVDMNTLLVSMVKKWRYLYSLQHIELLFHPANENVLWASNSLWLQRLFDNVFQNTLKHSKATKLEIKVEDGRISFRDNGIGFDTKAKSRGLGLNIIGNLAKVLGLRYTLQSNEAGTLVLFEEEDNRH